MMEAQAMSLAMIREQSIIISCVRKTMISTYAHGGSLGPNLFDFLRLQLIKWSHFARHCFNL